jgi:uncharacterized protein (TIGR02646 family)
MKYIPKELKNEPSCLRDYRLTEGAKYQSITGLNEALLNEQGAICAYCMRRISIDFKRYNVKTYIPQVGVEHIASQESYPDKQLDYRNLVAVCNGLLGEANHCDKTEEYTWQGSKKKGKINGKVTLEKLYPTNPDCEKLIGYNANGLLKSVNNDEMVEEDILKLNLNDEKLKGYRRNTIDAARTRLKQNKRLTTWTQRDFEKEIEFWSSKSPKNGQLTYQPFCQIALWYLIK